MAIAETFVTVLCSILITSLLLTPNAITLGVNYATDRSSVDGFVELEDFYQLRSASIDLAIEEYSSAEYLFGVLARIHTTKQGSGPALPQDYYGPHSFIDKSDQRTERAQLVTEGNEVRVGPSQHVRFTRARSQDKPPREGVSKELVDLYVWGGMTHIALFGSAAPSVEWLHFALLTAMLLPAVFLGTKPLVALVAILGMLGSVLYAGLLLTLPFYALALFLAYKLTSHVYPNGLIDIIKGQAEGPTTGLGISTPPPRVGLARPDVEFSAALQPGGYPSFGKATVPNAGTLG